MREAVAAFTITHYSQLIAEPLQSISRCCYNDTPTDKDQAHTVKLTVHASTMHAPALYVAPHKISRLLLNAPASLAAWKVTRVQHMLYMCDGRQSLSEALNFRWWACDC